MKKHINTTKHTDYLYVTRCEGTHNIENTQIHFAKTYENTQIHFAKTYENTQKSGYYTPLRRTSPDVLTTRCSLYTASFPHFMQSISSFFLIFAPKLQNQPNDGQIRFIMMRKVLLAIALWSVSSFFVCAQEKIHVIIDNDFAGDPDGLYALAHLVKSPSVDVRAIIGSHLHEKENWAEPGWPSAASAVKSVGKILSCLGSKEKYPLVQGSNVALQDTTTYLQSEAVDVIIAEAKKCDSQSPLYVLCGGGLTEIASAWLKDRSIAEHIVLVWIGGAEYPGILPPPGIKGQEYNTTIDVKAAQVVFNNSNLKMWQIPRNAYRQCLVSYSILARQAEKSHTVATDLLQMLDRYIGKGKQSESYVLGDSPLVLVTALQSNWERDACSSSYRILSCPVVDDKGQYSFPENRRKIRVYDRLDTYLMFEDMFAKFAGFSRSE